MLFYRFRKRDYKMINPYRTFRIFRNRKEKVLSLRTMIKTSRFVCALLSHCKRVSLYLSLTKNRLVGSMTVEATLVMPLFLFALLNLISVIEIYRVQSNLSAAMHRTAREMAVYAYEYQELSEGERATKLESLGLTYLYAAQKVEDILGTEYLEKSPIKGGAEGISWLRSSVLEENDCIDLIATYLVAPTIEIPGFRSFTMCNRIRARAWTGYDTTLGEYESWDGELVYITPYGEVYHLSSYCTHLKLSIQEVDIERIGEYRNLDGQRYTECDRCFDEYAVVFYITDYGELAHCSLTCSSLKRTIELVPLSEVQDRSLCKKCESLYGES